MGNDDFGGYNGDFGTGDGYTDYRLSHSNDLSGGSGGGSTGGGSGGGGPEGDSSKGCLIWVLYILGLLYAINFEQQSLLIMLIVGGILLYKTFAG